MRISFETNILAYFEGGDDVGRRRQADELVTALSAHDLVLPVQVSAELYRYLIRKKKLTRSLARDAIVSWQALMTEQPTTTDTAFDAALGLATDHQFQIFDAIVLAASAEAGCRLRLSEDMQDGFAWRGVTIVNPFAATPHPLLFDALQG